MIKRSDTIAAISTPYGKSGIGVIRISGENALKISQTIISAHKPLHTYLSINQRKLIYATLKGQNNEMIDEILVALMPEKRSFTGELLVELHCHGSMAVMKYAIEKLTEAGARLAEPGEFTRRALEHDRINLIQAEAINEIINAPTIFALKSIWKKSQGDLGKRVDLIRNEIIKILSLLQSEIDFNLEEKKPLEFKTIKHRIKGIVSILNGITEKESDIERMIQGFKIVIFGAPNVGKSTLFNAILDRDRSIVCENPGTTRDSISELIGLKGYDVILVDTAGIRKTKIPIEKKSIARSRDQIISADILIYVMDYSKNIDKGIRNEAERVLKKSGIVVINKTDKKGSRNIHNFIDTHKNMGHIILTSAKKNINVDKIKQVIYEIMVNRQELLEGTNFVFTNRRQMGLIKYSQKRLNNILNSKHSISLDIISEEVNNARMALEEITGKISVDEILDTIFKSFCVGK